MDICEDWDTGSHRSGGTLLRNLAWGFETIKTPVAVVNLGAGALLKPYCKTVTLFETFGVLRGFGAMMGNVIQINTFKFPVC